jgi:genome maintenance exonuclease 1
MSAKGIAEWKERIGSEQASKVLAQASRRGTAVHSLCEKYLLNEENYIRGAMPSNVSLFKQIQPYMDKYIGKVYGIEIPLYSDELKSAGTCDLFCQLHGINAVVDFKTSAHAKEEKYIENYFFQATAYAIMLEERYKISVPSIGLLVAVEDDNLQVFLKHTSEFRKKVVSHFKNYSCINSLDSL